MVALVDLPTELLVNIVTETARVWPHALWQQPMNPFKRLEDDSKKVDTSQQPHPFSECPAKGRNCTLCTDTKLGFISLTHVCRTLREIIISMPDLWTFISDAGYPYPDVKWLQTFLARSQDLPLNYYHRVDWGLHDQSRGLKLHDIYSKALPRIRTLNLSVRGGPPTLDIFSEFMPDAKSLESLVLLRVPTYPLRLSDQSPSTRLRELDLLAFDPTSMPWQHDGVRNLTRLRLVFAHMRPASFASLLNGLRMLRSIETLNLRNIPVLISEEAETALDIEDVAFSHLKTLTLHGRTRGVMELLSRITAPNVRSVDLTCFKFIAEIKPVLARLSQWVPGLAPSRNSDLRDNFVTASIIHDESKSTLTLCLSRTPDAEDGPFHFRVTADWEQRWATEGEEDQENLSPADVLEIIVPTVVDPGAASRVKHLTVWLDACPSESLRRCILPFTSVSTLSVRGVRTASRLVELMAQSDTVDASASSLFPELTMFQTIAIQDNHEYLDDQIATMAKSRAQRGQAIQWRILRP
ncbi:unnamed protein product [Peniophora sp. CBMAI 1063]|nr:unnamed protein product [Peniophora sp. CBMAI 1063]